MRTLAAAALLLLLPALAAAGESDAPAEKSPFPIPYARVEPRQLVKKGHVFLALGPSALLRNDYFNSPGLLANAAFYVTENTGLELLAAAFATSPSSAGRQIQDSMGWIPDARRPHALLQAGWRPTFAFGKALVGNSLLYFDAHLGVRAGLLLTDGPSAPTFSLAPGLLARLGEHLVFSFETAVPVSYEHRRHGAMALGVMPTLLLGVKP